jgi:nucleotide-binding universal stress UspA family protein
MRLALVLSRVPRRLEVTGFPLDDVSIVAAHDAGEDLEVFVDLDTDGAQALRDAGIPVSVAPKRGAFTTTAGEVLSDRHTVAAAIMAAHGARPFDAMLVGEDVPVDLAWYEPALGRIPRGVVIGAGPVSDHRLVFGQPGLAEASGAEVWRITGVIGTADFVVADAPPGDYGLSGPLPPRLGWGRPPETADPGSMDPRTIVVVALGEPPVGYGSLVARVDSLVPIAETTLVAVVAPDTTVGGEAVGSLIAAGIPRGRELNVIVVHPGADGVAAAFLESADLVVAGRPSDLAVPALRDLHVPVVVMDGRSALGAPSLWAAGVPGRRPAGEAALVQGDGPPAEVIAAAEDALADQSIDRVVLFAGAMAPTALEVAETVRLEGADLVVVGAPSGVYGEPTLEALAPGVIGVSRRCWPSVRRRLAVTGSVWELQVWMLGLSSVPHATLAVVPGRSRRWERLPTHNVTGIPSWVTSSGLLPLPDLAGVGAGREAVPPLGDEASPETVVRKWVMQRSWSQRLRLALPAKGGLLRRAMKGRW